MTKAQLQQKEEQIQRIMRGLDVTREEAESIFQFDKEIENGADPFPQTAEQKKVSKKMCGIGTKEGGKMTNYTRKPDVSKNALMASIAEVVSQLDGITDFEVVNESREVRFRHDGNLYALVLSKKKK